MNRLQARSDNASEAPAKRPKVGAVDVAAAGAISIAFAAAWALHAGADGNWDLRNYHFWSAWSLLNGRTFFDVAPAQVQSWMNPLVHVPSHFVVRHASTFWGTLVMGAWAGLNGFVVHAVAVRTIRGGSDLARRALAAGATAVGLTGPIFLSQVGTTFPDVLTSILVVGALAAALSPGRSRLAVSGALLGASVGLKLTNAPYAAGMAIALVAAWRPMAMTLPRYASFAAAGLAGAALTGGPWAGVLYAETGSPIFPFYNALFRSPLHDPVSFADPRFSPKSIGEALAYPFLWLAGSDATAEVPFRDARFAILSVTLPAAAIAASVGVSDGGKRLVTERGFVLLGAFFFAAYAVWLALWGIQRYATTLELLSGVVLLASVDRLPLPIRGRIALFVALAALAVAWTQPANWGRLQDWGDEYFDVRGAPDVGNREALYVVVGGDQPMSYVLPFFRGRTRFVRLTGNMGSLLPDRPMGRWANRVIAGHRGALWCVSAGRRRPEDDGLLRAHGLEREAGVDCGRIRTRYDRFLVCPLRRLDSG